MKTRMLFSLLTATVLVSFLSISVAVGQVIYDSIPSPLPGNLESLGFQCCALNEVGDEVQLAGTNRSLESVTVTLSDWACESGHWSGATGPCITTPGATFRHPITLHIYDASFPPPFSPLATITKDFDIPYRPSQSTNCLNHKWYDSSSGECHYGLVFNITFDNLNVDLPDKIIFGVTYNTSKSGYNPLGAPGPYDSLQVALRNYTQFGPSLSVGSDLNNNAMFLSCTRNFYKCKPNVSAPLHQETGCYPYTPSIRFTSAFPVPKTKDDCKEGGWRNLSRTRTEATPFKNQGDCIQYVNTGK